MLISLRGGTLRQIVKKLERLGWRRILMFEIRKIIRKASVDY